MVDLVLLHRQFLRHDQVEPVLMNVKQPVLMEQKIVYLSIKKKLFFRLILKLNLQ